MHCGIIKMHQALSTEGILGSLTRPGSVMRARPTGVPRLVLSLYTPAFYYWFLCEPLLRGQLPRLDYPALTTRCHQFVIWSLGWSYDRCGPVPSRSHQKRRAFDAAVDHYSISNLIPTSMARRSDMRVGRCNTQAQ